MSNRVLFRQLTELFMSNTQAGKAAGLLHGLQITGASYLKQHGGVHVIHLDVDLAQEVLHLLQGHHVVVVFVCLPHAADDPALTLM